MSCKYAYELFWSIFLSCVVQYRPRVTIEFGGGFIGFSRGFLGGGMTCAYLHSGFSALCLFFLASFTKGKWQYSHRVCIFLSLRFMRCTIYSGLL